MTHSVNNYNYFIMNFQKPIATFLKHVLESTVLRIYNNETVPSKTFDHSMLYCMPDYEDRATVR